MTNTIGTILLSLNSCKRYISIIMCADILIDHSNKVSLFLVCSLWCTLNRLVLGNRSFCLICVVLCFFCSLAVLMNYFDDCFFFTRWLWSLRYILIHYRWSWLTFWAIAHQISMISKHQWWSCMHHHLLLWNSIKTIKS